MNQTKDNMCNWHYQDVIGGVLFVLPSQTLATSFIQTVSCCFLKFHMTTADQKQCQHLCVSHQSCRDRLSSSLDFYFLTAQARGVFYPPVTGALSL